MGGDVTVEGIAKLARSHDNVSILFMGKTRSVGQKGGAWHAESCAQ